MISRTFVLVAALLTAQACAQSPKSETRLLLNGKDLAGWETFMAEPLATSAVPGLKRDEKGNYTEAIGVNRDPLGVFKVETVDGEAALHLSGEGFGTLTSLASYSNFHLKVQFKWGDKKWGASNKPRNAGLLYHAHGAEGAVAGRWMNSHQFQIQEGECGEYIVVGDTAAEVHARKLDAKRWIYDPMANVVSLSGSSANGTRCSKAELFEKPTGEWNTLELICLGDRIIHVVNGHVVLRAESSATLVGGVRTVLDEGKIQLQMEGSEIFFRRIELTPITEVPVVYAAP